MRKYLPILILILIASCKSRQDLLATSLHSENGHYQAVIEIPAGTNAKVEYDKNLRLFSTSLRNGKERIIDFLAYPANYGFIPSTYSDPANGGDGDALDIMILSSTLKSGDIVEFVPIGMIKMIDAGEEDFKIIGVPARRELRTIQAENYQQLSENYPGALNILETWFSNYDLEDNTVIQGWGDEKDAIKEIERLRLKL
ncbi:inorganic pyrophosphatase [Gramella sp. Hel_I_59]|uniref:inorganic diphosphatase n=1 Tax=Gramella sp. Hel_I_59 TaxID=1249978 RepID=UPI0011525831|nr:inorganic diphosphatase [Gramella sp. Hel_I_59]TQI69888.1 inorganic pyrophosphatase [Gramella sp. Hel_I_59]